MNSLRLRLTATLLLVIAAVGLLTALAVYLDARQEINESFDYELRAVAESIDPGAEGSSGPRAPGRLPDDDILVQVWSAAGTLVYPSDPAQQAPPPRQDGYDTLASTAGRDDWRSFVVRRGDIRVQAAQPLQTRRELAAEESFRVLIPGLVALPLLALLIGGVVRHHLAPVSRLAQALSTRTQGTNQRIAVSALPLELHPLVSSFNQVLERLSESLAAQRALVADAAHELRTPLAVLRLQVQHLQRLQAPAERFAAEQSLVGGIDRMTRLVTQLLTLARLEPGAPRERSDPICLDTLVREVLADLMPLASARRIELSLVSSPIIVIRGDVTSLRALIGNLVDNALRYTPEPGSVSVTLSSGPDIALLQVRDTGPGLSEVQRRLVFQRFYRVPGTQGEGSGLGLAIAHTVAERHGGSIELGQGDGGGLCVEVRLPMSADEPVAGPTPAPSASAFEAAGCEPGLSCE